MIKIKILAISYKFDPLKLLQQVICLPAQSPSLIDSYNFFIPWCHSVSMICHFSAHFSLTPQLPQLNSVGVSIHACTETQFMQMNN